MTNNKFVITANEVPALLKIMDTAFYVIKHNNMPEKVAYTNQEVRRMYKLSNHLYNWLNELDDQAEQQIDLQNYLEGEQQ